MAIFDATTLDLLYVLPALRDDAVSLAFSTDGATLATGFASGATIVWKLSTRTAQVTFGGHTKAVEGVAFRSDGKALYTVSQDGQVLSWSLSETRPFPPSRVFADNPRKGYIGVPSPDGATIAYVSYPVKGTALWGLQFRDVESGKLTQERPLDLNSPSVWNVSWTPDSSEFVATGGVRPDDESASHHMYQVWEPGKEKPTYTDFDAGIDTALFLSDNESMVTIDIAGGTVTLRDRETRDPLSEPIAVGTWTFETASLSPDERTLYLWVAPDATDGAESQGHMAVVDLASGEVEERSLETIPSIMNFSPDGSRVVLYGWDGSWGILATEDLGSDDPEWLVARRKYDGSSDFPYPQWTADSSHLLVMGPGTLEVWDASNLTTVGTLQIGEGDQGADLLIPPDGSTFMMAHAAGAISTWDVRPQYVLEVACAKAGRNLTPDEWSELVGERPYHETCPA